ncbi:MAG: hypothetical protein MUE85_03180 [Microscillaceae bacterium]|jgi:hypothetical protein|nr:hypothetical protein [Microscillaceae bacterium]
MSYRIFFSQIIHYKFSANGLIIKPLPHLSFGAIVGSLGLLLLVFPIFAQTDGLKTAEETQKYIANHIEKREFHLNELKFNANRFATHQAEYFQRFEKYFYTIDRRDAQAPKALLMAVIIRIEKDRTQYHREYNFDKTGDLVYYTEQQIESNSPPQSRLKVYFSQGKVLKWSEGDNYSMVDMSDYPSSQTQAIINNATKYYKKFAQQINEAASN